MLEPKRLVQQTTLSIALVSSHFVDFQTPERSVNCMTKRHSQITKRPSGIKTRLLFFKAEEALWLPNPLLSDSLHRIQGVPS